MKNRPQTKLSAHQAGETFQEVLSRNIARRSFLKGALISAPLLLAGPVALQRHFAQAEEDNGLKFKPIDLDNQDRMLVAEGYDAKVLIRWGDPVFKNSPVFNPFNQSKLTQEQQFGYNCDYVSYHSLPHRRAINPTQALLWINHEYTNEDIMFPEYDAANPTREQVDVALAAHGGTIIEIRKSQKAWEVVAGSRFNRRITAETEIEITAPPQETT
jgi:secreted PhoX family phosphatase